MASVGDTVYAYGVIPAAEVRSISSAGVEGAAVAAVDHAALAALVSRFEGRAATTARDVRAHWRVLDEAFEQGTTVLPLRFGTVFDTEDAVRECLLEPHAVLLTELLAGMAGRVQLNVKGRYSEQLLLRQVVQSSPAVADLRERVRNLPDDASTYGARLRLGELVAREVAQRRAEDTQIALSSLEPLAVAIRDEQLTDENAAFNLACLVERDRRRRFDSAVGALRDMLDDRIEIDYVGPLPPFSFTQTDLTAGSAAWA